MPTRITPLVNDEYYHIYNRGVAYQQVFLNKRDYQHFILTLSFYRFTDLPFRLSRLLQLPEKLRKDYLFQLEENGKKLVDILCFVLMPNHFHLILKQISDNGISTFMRLSINSWVRYFNSKYHRPGTLFQGAFRAKRIETDEQLLHLSRYIHLNPLVTYLVKEKDLFNYPWSSLPYYVKGKSFLVDLVPVLSHFSTFQKYIKFVLDRADYAKEPEKIKHLIIE